MFRSWKLGTAFGIGIYVHWTFMLLPVLVLLNTAGLGSLAATLFLMLLTLAVFGCVVLHELGHALMARYFGIPTYDITLYPIGGVARLARMSERPWEEFSIALAGPAVNVLIAAVLGAALAATDLLTPGNFLFELLAANIMLAVFNLLPAFPMDGGRVLRALLALRLGTLRATEIAAALGTGMALLFFAIGFWHASFMLLALFVFFMGQQELLATRQREWQRRQQPLEVLSAEDEVLDATYRPSEPHFTGFTWDPHMHHWVEWRNGRAVNVIAVR